ncbi:MAG: hypothetical protein QM533_05425 [Cytophagales bacterium]|nr:hypothetical protein [Cytophagales bacterium]
MIAAPLIYSPHQLSFFAHQLTRRAASSSMDAMATALLDGQVHDADITEKLLTLPCGKWETVQLEATDSGKLELEILRQHNKIVASLEERNVSAFSQEAEKLDAWADDLKVGLEREIKELDRAIREARTKSRGAATLAEKLTIQKEQRDLEDQRDKKRRELFDRQDDIQRKRDTLIDELEQQLKQTRNQHIILHCEWELQ